MSLTTILIAIGLLAVMWYVTTTILIYDALRKRNIKVSFLFLRILILKYASQYKEITLKETGKVGPLFYHWIIPINIALISVILILLIRIA
jgi:hypothetical protein